MPRAELARLRRGSGPTSNADAGPVLEQEWAGLTPLVAVARDYDDGRAPASYQTGKR